MAATAGNGKVPVSLTTSDDLPANPIGSGGILYDKDDSEIFDIGRL